MQCSKALLFDAILKQHVTSNPFLQPKDGLTHCNQFVQLVADEMQVPLKKQLANAMYDDMKEGKEGWLPCLTVVSAQEEADKGQLTIGIWKNPSGEHGHVVIVRPSLEGQLGVRVAQAGGHNSDSCTLAQAFGFLGPVLYFTHL